MKRGLLSLLVLLAWASSAWCAPALVQVCSNHSTTGTTLNCNKTGTGFDSPVTAGDLLIVVFRMGTNQFTSIQDTLGTTWRQDNAGTTPRTYSGVAPSTGADTISVTTTAGSSISISAGEFSGTTQTLDGVVVTTSATNNTPICGDATHLLTTNANDLVFCWFSKSASETISTGPTDSGSTASTWTSGGANISGSLNTLGWAYEVESATGTYGASYTTSSTGGWNAQIIAYQAPAVAVSTCNGLSRQLIPGFIGCAP